MDYRKRGKMNSIRNAIYLVGIEMRNAIRLLNNNCVMHLNWNNTPKTNNYLAALQAMQSVGWLGSVVNGASKRRCRMNMQFSATIRAAMVMMLFDVQKNGDNQIKESHFSEKAFIK